MWRVALGHPRRAAAIALSLCAPRGSSYAQLDGGLYLGRVASMRTNRRFSRTADGAAPVTPMAFAQHLRAVGLSKETLPQLYTDTLGPASGHTWAARSCDEFPVAVALSGGADSMALMLLLKEFLEENRVQTPLLAITVDHQLRAESTDEARHVGDHASRRWGVKHVIMACDWNRADRNVERHGAPRKSKLQEAARTYRYELLTEACRQHGVKCLFVAHNLGDQLETVLFRLGRASGINGLAGIAPITDLVSASDSQDSISLLRPLLHVSKASLKVTCERFEQPWVEDPSNESLVFDRIRIRKALETVEKRSGGREDWDALLAFQRIAAEATAEFVAREKEVLERHVLQWADDHIVVSFEMLTDVHCFDELAMRILTRLVRRVGGKPVPPRLSSLKILYRDLRSLGRGKQITLSGCCITKKRRGAELHFQPEHGN